VPTEHLNHSVLTYYVLILFQVKHGLHETAQNRPGTATANRVAQDGLTEAKPISWGDEGDGFRNRSTHPTASAAPSAQSNF
jgi:hypothetical protein